MTHHFNMELYELQSAPARARYHEEGKPAPLFVARPCEAAVFLCDHCDLQSVCDYEFDNGAKCPIIARRRVWLRLPPDVIRKT